MLEGASELHFLLSGSLILWPFQNPWSAPEVMLAFFTLPSSVESFFDTLLV